MFYFQFEHFLTPIFWFYRRIAHEVHELRGVWFATSVAGTANPSGGPVFTPQFLVGFVLLDL
jgi:hypothetical protein